MNIEEIEREIERVDTGVDKNTDLRYVSGLSARGTWQVALQIARLSDLIERLVKAGDGNK